MRGVLGGELHNNCLVVGVLSLVAARSGDGLDALRPGAGAVARASVRGVIPSGSPAHP
ncbi:hypothetical protein GCM10019016_110570 [Streptomyces prasinosporus]|uniref:Uncharacterized protein n=1 Tax=Streptomyces prasinosporus TaxID=68256 RepID=A0ABP6UBM5_9ACTN